MNQKFQEEHARRYAEPPRNTGKGFRFVAVSDLEYAPPEFLVDGLIERDTLGLVFGDPGCGKSFLGVDLALSVATGHPFHTAPVKRGAVFYIAGEGHNGLVRRFHAWAVERGRSLEGVSLFKSECAAQFLDKQSAQSVEHAISQLAAQHGRPAMVVVDTLARNFGPGDENSTEQMSAFVAAMDMLRTAWPGCVILIIHHSGHHDKQRGRGSMALKAAVDFEFRLEKTANTMKLTNTKMKDAEPPKDMVFTLKDVPLAEGARSAALVISEERVETSVEAHPKMNRDARLARDTFAEVAASFGPDSGFQIDLEAWRTAFHAKHTGDNPASKRQAFKRGRDALVDKGLIEAENDVYRCIDPAMRLAINMTRKQRDTRDVT
jgi:KaiC/GvpD/RAD55 family RecA-like ATPase